MMARRRRGVPSSVTSRTTQRRRVCASAMPCRNAVNGRRFAGIEPRPTESAPTVRPGHHGRAARATFIASDSAGPAPDPRPTEGNEKRPRGARSRPQNSQCGCNLNRIPGTKKDHRRQVVTAAAVAGSSPAAPLKADRRGTTRPYRSVRPERTARAPSFHSADRARRRTFIPTRGSFRPPLRVAPGAGIGAASGGPAWYGRGPADGIALRVAVRVDLRAVRCRFGTGRRKRRDLPGRRSGRSERTRISPPS